METNAGNGSSNTGNHVAKKEKFNEEIKEFAETAMNELLGWYGYNTTKDDLKTMKRRCHSYSGSNSSGPDSPKYTEGCGWCGKTIEETSSISSGIASFCSELCFSQSRRANFKKNKTCDWCRHVRHTVSYVDFQDGASQLQFCSDKCLNQYKMHIFCRETEAHLELHPHLPGDEKSGGSLITPDLWLKNCQSPDSTRIASPAASPPPNHQPSQIPLISVAPASKLMPVADAKKPNRNKIQKKHHRKRQPINYSVYNDKTDDDLPQDLSVRQPSNETPAKEVRVKPIDGFVANSNPHRFYQPTSVNQRSDLPTVTVLVPYPVVVPFPVPIPIPIPLGGLLTKQKDHQNDGVNEKIVVDDEKIEEESTKVVDGCNVEDLVVVGDEVKMSGRPLRKRKRLLDGKTRVLNKKKSLVV